MGRELSQKEKVRAKELEDILLTHKHIIKIEHDPRWHIPDIDYSKFKPETTDISQGLVKILKKYLRSPYIEDDFEANHEDRREWRDRLEQQYEWFHDFYENNVLKYGNKCATLSLLFELIEPHYIASDTETFKELLKKADDLCNLDSLEYNQRSLQEKIGYIKQIKHAVYDVLDFLSYDKCSLEDSQ